MVRQQGKARSGPGTLGNGLGGQAVGGGDAALSCHLQASSLSPQAHVLATGPRGLGALHLSPSPRLARDQGPRVAKRTALLLDFQKSAGHDSLGIRFLIKHREKRRGQKGPADGSAQWG